MQAPHCFLSDALSDVIFTLPFVCCYNTVIKLILYIDFVFRELDTFNNALGDSSRYVTSRIVSSVNSTDLLLSVQFLCLLFRSLRHCSGWGLSKTVNRHGENRCL